MTHLRRFIAVIFLFVTINAYALVPTVGSWTLPSASGIPGSWPTADAACSAYFDSKYPNGDALLKWFNNSDWRCEIRYPNGEVRFDSLLTRATSCPANSLLVPGTSTCTCNAGFVEKNGQCVAPDKCSGLASLCSGMSGSQKSFAMYDGDAQTFCHTPPDDLFWDQPKYPGCNQGCLAKTGPSTGVTDSTGKTLWKGMGTLTGGLCTNGTPTEPSAPDAPPPAEKSDPVDKRCAGQSGTVNGKEVCIPASSATGVDWTGKTQNSDGTSTEGKTVTTCTDGVCESTTTKTNKDANGNVTGTTTTTDKVSQEQYCAKTKNKDGMLCAAVNANPVPGKDNQTGGNSGTGSGNGDGDGCTITDCKSDSGGGPGKVGLPGTGAGEFGKLYEPKYPQGPGEVWKQSSAGIKNSGLGSLAIALMPKIADGGSAPVWIVDFNFSPLGDFGVHDISPPLWVWEVLKAITILTALIVARRLIFGG